MDGKQATLAELGLTAQGGREARLTGLSLDSREVREGHLFAALPGSVAHGAGFVEAALELLDEEDASWQESETQQDIFL